MASKQILTFARSGFGPSVIRCFSHSATVQHPTRERVNSRACCVQIFNFFGNGTRTHQKGFQIRRFTSRSQSIRFAQVSAAPAQEPKKNDTEDDEASRKDDPASVLRNLEEIQARQKRILEAPELKDPHIIYTGLLKSQMRRLKILSFTSSLMGLALQPVLIQKSSEVPLLANVAIMGSVAFFTFGTPILIHLVCKKYITEIEYEPVSDTYTAATMDFFMRKNSISFKINDVVVPDVPGPFTSFTVKGSNGKIIPLFVAPEGFIQKSHYGRFMGYDKPINLHLNVNDKKTDSPVSVSKEKSNK